MGVCAGGALMAHDFSTLIDRTAQGSAKWAAMRRANPEVPVGIPPFSVADLDLPQAPEIVAGLREFLADAVLGYTEPTPACTRALIDWMTRRHDWRIAPDSIVWTNGVVPALCTAVRALTPAGAGVIVQPPVYYPFYSAIERNGRRVVRNPLLLQDGRYRMDLEGLRRLAADPANTMLILCSPHNPVGRVWTHDELRAVAAIAVEHELIVVSDEIHCDLVLPGHRHTTLASLGQEIARRSIVCTAPSKTFNLAGLCTSHIVISDAALRGRFRAELESQGQFFVSAPGLKACELAYTHGQEWLDGLLRLIASNQALLREFLRERLPTMGVLPLEGTYLQWLDFRKLGMSAAALKRAHQDEAVVFFAEGTTFGAEGAGFARMNIAAPRAALLAALERLALCHGPGGPAA